MFWTMNEAKVSKMKTVLNKDGGGVSQQGAREHVRVLLIHQAAKNGQRNIKNKCAMCSNVVVKHLCCAVLPFYRH